MSTHVKTIINLALIFFILLLAGKEYWECSNRWYAPVHHQGAPVFDYEKIDAK